MTDRVPINQSAVINYWSEWRTSRVRYTQSEWLAELEKHGIGLNNDGAIYVVIDESRYLEFVLRWA